MPDPTDPTENTVPPPPAGKETILAGRKIVIVVSEDWYFCSHRLPLGKALHAAGAEVIVATRVRDHGGIIEQAGLRIIPIGLDRSGLNPLHDLGTLRELLGIYRRERPDLVHHVALKPTLYGALCARLTGVPAVVNALAGLGYLFSSATLKARVLRPVARLGLRALVNRRNSRTILQNPDDVALFESELGARPDRLALIRGSGVDTTRFRPHPPPDGTPVAVCVSRMLWDKGIDELVEAARLLRQRGTDIKIRLVGPTDKNPASIPQATLDHWRAEGIVDLAGPIGDIPGEYARAHIAVLPSYREGLPKSLLEAAACGRPMVATDVPGCREICREDETGLLVPARSVEPLADALERLARDADLRNRLGARARQVAESEFAEEVVIAETLALYRDLLTK
ncbi:MAG: glycosyltransferase family 4 protein [Alphaproteobacteria bacterium]|nr:glycosyltransferase family 4 protein [Alphaproteobacteria bacterium]